MQNYIICSAQSVPALLVMNPQIMTQVGKRYNQAYFNLKNIQLGQYDFNPEELFQNLDSEHKTLRSGASWKKANNWAYFNLEKIQLDLGPYDFNPELFLNLDQIYLDLDLDPDDSRSIRTGHPDPP